jgi:RimJ/RimL family protein N-acetyltransferase
VFEPDYPVRTARLLLRPFAAGDLTALHDFHRLPEVARYLLNEPRDRTEVSALLEVKIKAAALAGEGALCLAADLAETGELVGDCTLFWRSREHRLGEIGFVFHPAYQGRGLATEAAAALLWLGFDGLRLHRIIGRCDGRNSASAAVMERIGMRREAHLVENEFIKGEWTDELIYAILRREWEDRGAISAGPGARAGG